MHQEKGIGIVGIDMSHLQFHCLNKFKNMLASLVISWMLDEWDNWGCSNSRLIGDGMTRVQGRTMKVSEENSQDFL